MIQRLDKVRVLIMFKMIHWEKIIMEKFLAMGFNNSWLNDCHFEMSFTDVPGGADPKRVAPRTVNISQCVTDRVSMIDKITHPKQVSGYRGKIYTYLSFI